MLRPGHQLCRKRWQVVFRTLVSCPLAPATVGNMTTGDYTYQHADRKKKSRRGGSRSKMHGVFHNLDGTIKKPLRAYKVDIMNEKIQRFHLTSYLFMITDA